ncbi:MAG: metal-dependent transcriptional regulator [Planctomycetota bacterium]|nr:MAG: metal-dependent transcriptional regulator [Planctomycetota bacterium]REK30025.1 MAG: metal-dependent transcriptional regulator [Planctomycetota bacterium]REK37732.1 MAG: metal-dependent transcriptional regulator [Planctomycetota bacterium]
MPSLTVENYCKAIYQLGVGGDEPWITTGQVAEQLQLAPGTVTSMLKTLAESGLAEYRPYEGVRLTRSGRLLALRMLRRHRLLELFLVETLGLTWDEVHDEAEHMEHAVSDALADRIDEYLGRPDRDPHGDPIPRSDGTLRGQNQRGSPLCDCLPGRRVRIVRVLQQGAEFLRYLAESGVSIGAEAVVEDNNEQSGVVTLNLAGRSLSIGRPAASQVMIEPVPAPGGADSG